MAESYSVSTTTAISNNTHFRESKQLQAKNSEPRSGKRSPAPTESLKVDNYSPDRIESDATLIALAGAPVTTPAPTLTAPGVKVLPFLGPWPRSFDPAVHTLRPVGPGLGKRTMFGSDGWNLGHWTRIPNVLTGHVQEHLSVKAEAVLKSALEAIAPPPELSSWNIGQNIQRNSAHNERLHALYDKLEQEWAKDAKRSFRDDSQVVFEEWGHDDYAREAFDTLVNADREFVVHASFDTIASRGGDEAARLEQARKKFGDSQVGNWLLNNGGVAGFDEVLQEKLAAHTERQNDLVRDVSRFGVETKLPEVAAQALLQIRKMAANRPTQGDVETQLNYEAALQDLIKSTLPSLPTDSPEAQELGRLSLQPQVEIDHSETRWTTEERERRGQERLKQKVEQAKKKIQRGTDPETAIEEATAYNDLEAAQIRGALAMQGVLPLKITPGEPLELPDNLHIPPNVRVVPDPSASKPLPQLPPERIVSLKRSGFERNASLDVFSERILDDAEEALRDEGLDAQGLYNKLRRDRQIFAYGPDPSNVPSDPMVPRFGVERSRPYWTYFTDRYEERYRERIERIFERKTERVRAGVYKYTFEALIPEIDDKPVKLTELVRSSATGDIAWYHPDAETKKDVVNHINKLADELLGTEMSFDATVDRLAEIHWLFAHAVPTERGSALIGDWYVRALARAKDIDLGSWKPNVGPDLEALTSTMKDFVRRYPNLFVRRPVTRPLPRHP